MTSELATDTPPELHLELPAYRGPMDMLLELIHEHQIDIFDIPIANITHHYLKYVDQMQALDLHIGGEWLEMAATLVFIKSQLLLPPSASEKDDVQPDPRDELVRRLIEHQVFQLAAEKLDARPQLQRDFFLPAPRPQQEREPDPPRPAPLRQASLFELVDALKRVIDHHEEKPEWVYEITREKLTLQGVILDIASLLEDTPRVSFDTIFAHGEITRHRIVTTFLALLEMSRLNMIRLFQPRLSDEKSLLIERAVIDIVEVSQSLDFMATD